MDISQEAQTRKFELKIPTTTLDLKQKFNFLINQWLLLGLLVSSLSTYEEYEEAPSSNDYELIFISLCYPLIFQNIL